MKRRGSSVCAEGNSEERRLRRDLWYALVFGTRKGNNRSSVCDRSHQCCARCTAEAVQAIQQLSGNTQLLGMGSFLIRNWSSVLGTEVEHDDDEKGHFSVNLIL